MSSFRKPLSGVRFGPSTSVKGRTSPGTETPFQFTSSVQPASGKEKLTLPEGVREKNVLRLYTSTLLKSVSEKNNTRADIITIDGDEFEVIRVLPWQNNVIPHYKVFVSQINA